jgi:integrase
LKTTGQGFRYAIAHGHARRNPATEIRPRDILKSARKSNFARVDAKELPALLSAIEVYPGKHITRLAIKLMALTFVRTREPTGAKWSEFDIEGAPLDIPAHRMKMRTSHIVPLSKQALEILDTQPEHLQVAAAPCEQSGDFFATRFSRRPFRAIPGHLL